MTEVAKKTTETKFIELNFSASERCKEAFKAWCANQGYRTLSEGFRAAVDKLTNFNDGSQVQNPVNPG